MIFPNLIRAPLSEPGSLFKPGSRVSIRSAALFPNLIRPSAGCTSVPSAGEPDSRVSPLLPNLVRSLNQVREFPSRRTA